MQAIGVIGFSLAGVDLFPRPPRRPTPRPSRKQRPIRRQAISNAIREFLASADEEIIPRLRHYPY
jgi:hypothetical protein